MPQPAIVRPPLPPPTSLPPPLLEKLTGPLPTGKPDLTRETHGTQMTDTCSPCMVEEDSSHSLALCEQFEAAWLDDGHRGSPRGRGGPPSLRGPLEDALEAWDVVPTRADSPDVAEKAAGGAKSGSHFYRLPPPGPLPPPSRPPQPPPGPMHSDPEQVMASMEFGGGAWWKPRDSLPMP
jgi:hypothetical protein